MAEKLTNEQQAAVDSRERSLLVSAAAGSGKTKVLVERLFSYVEREGADLDDFLIITYTRAAASELRGKIAKALTERMERDPGNEHLRRQMLRVYRADIKTVDAFCTALLRENCHLLSEDARGHALRPDFRVLDENEAQVRQFLQANPDFAVIAPQITLSGMRVGEYGTLFLPHETSTDGFFAAILERQKNC